MSAVHDIDLSGRGAAEPLADAPRGARSAAARTSDAPAAIAAPRVTSLEAWLVPLPLERPVRFAAGTWTQWRYVVVRARAADGRTGAAYAFIGELPIDLMVTELIAPAVVGIEDLGDLDDLAERLALAGGPSLVDSVRPASSLVEMCLWDLAAQDAGRPLWQLLAPTASPPARVPVMHVEHRREGDTPAAFAERVAAMAAEGVAIVKVKDYHDAAETSRRLAAIRAVAPPELELVVDAGWQWTDIDAAAAAARAWEPYAVSWIEDPFPPHRVREATELRAATSVPVGIGDLITSVDLAERLIAHRAVDVLRVDATTMGGYGGARRLTARAAGAGVDVSPELLAEQHQHVAFACPTARCLEIYSPASGVWSADAFARPGALAYADAGHALAPERPGSGLDLDWEAVERHAERASRHGEPA